LNPSNANRSAGEHFEMTQEYPFSRKHVSWLEVPEGSDFPLQNFPFGIFSTSGTEPRACTRLGDFVVDLDAMAWIGYFDGIGITDYSVFSQPVLNDFIALGKPVWKAIRKRLIELFSIGDNNLSANIGHKVRVLVPVSKTTLHLPLRIGDYTDFYSSIEHATNVGMMFRDPANALMPNWRHLPVGYHGRSSSVVISGTPVGRPKGQIKPADYSSPVFAPTSQLDFELETAFVIGRNTQIGNSIPVSKAEDYIFGLLLFNDLSARDIQSWEYVPLGPFLSKNFASAVSPWIVTLEALEPFRVKGPVQEPEVLPYLASEGARNFDIQLEVLIEAPNQEAISVCKSNYRYLYWNMSQQLAHHTVNGCNIRVGDLCGSGTISGPDAGSMGSMLEITWKGTKPILMPDGTERKFINDSDTIIMRGFCEKEGLRIGFGEVRTTILSAN
jgi:fumarylacetoacetase